MGDTRYVTEIPSSLKQLARLVVRGFYTIEDSLLIDMLVRNPCMKEDDLCELLKFERRQLRSRIAILKNDKFLQIRLKMETGPDGKAQKVNYYFINYKTFVNVVKYKLDLMRKRMETEERDATSRASFKCPSCNKTFTDLEADQLFDYTSNQFKCTHCGNTVEEDLSALPKKDSRLLLAKFNEQLQTLYDLLRNVENITLSPECLEPEPVDIDTIRGLVKPSQRNAQSSEHWSGEASRSHGFAVEETRVNVSIGNDAGDDAGQTQRKDRPVWMTESTVITNENSEDSLLDKPEGTSNGGGSVSASGNAQTTNTMAPNSRARREGEDIMSVLLAHEKKSGQLDSIAQGLNARDNNDDNSDSSGDEKEVRHAALPSTDDIMDSDDSDEESPAVMVAGKPYPLDEINDTLVAQMTPQEKEAYIQIYQENMIMDY